MYRVPAALITTEKGYCWT